MLLPVAESLKSRNMVEIKQTQMDEGNESLYVDLHFH